VFFLPESMRGQGLGSQLLQMAEEEGRRRGCRIGLLHTNDFQAPDFYRKHGWREYGNFASDPPGSSRLFFTKDLTTSSHGSFSA
jgi:GNAT superfamily N-acetyltransferase